ncbi:MAG: exonuclease domain-containing protein [Sphingomonadales bacterium]
MDFVALDFETSNSKRTSICQVGLATFRSGKLINQWTSFVDPNDHFEPINISIHGIDEGAVIGAPSFPEIIEKIDSKTKNLVLVSHSSFDIVALDQSCNFHDLPKLEREWLDTLRVARRTWDQFSKSGYGLGNLAKELGITFQHHDAGEDARVCGEILVRAIGESGVPLEDWLDRVKKPIGWGTPGYKSKTTYEANQEGPLFGESVVFTGALGLSRKDAKALAATAGCNVGSKVTGKTTLLILGDQDISRLAGHSKSSKHRKAEDLISKGHPIRIIGETDFIALTKLN